MPGARLNYAGLPKQVAIKTLQLPTPSHILFMSLRCLILLVFFNFSVTMETRVGGVGSGIPGKANTKLVSYWGALILYSVLGNY